MKILKPGEIFDLVAATEAETLAAVKLANVWGQHVAGDVYEERLLLDMVKSGAANVSTVHETAGGAPVYVIFWGVTASGWLFIHALIAVKTCDMRIAEKACCDIARANGCKVIQAATLRAGMMSFLTGESWRPLGVVLIKNL